jgi:hypothetical protein
MLGIMVLVFCLFSNTKGQIASNPSPADGAIHPSAWVNLSWSPGIGAVSHDVYFGEDHDEVDNAIQASGTFLGNTTNTQFMLGIIGNSYPDGLANCTTYYWRIDEVQADGFTIYRGPVWHFTTISDPPIADAGPDQAVSDFGCDGGESFVLDGSGSTDPDGYIVSYQWWASTTGDPADSVLIAQGSTATVTLPLGTYTVMLIVTDNDGCTDTDTVEITIGPSIGDILYGTITTTDPTGVVRALRRVMVTLDWGGTQYTVYTDGNGDYIIDVSNDNTFCVGSAVNGFLRVTLEDEGDGTDPYIKVYDNSIANPIFAETVNFNINTVNDLEQNVDLSNNPNINVVTLPIPIANLDDAAIIYFHTYQAVDFGLNTLGMGFDHVLPIEIIAWDAGGTRWNSPSTIFIGAGDSGFWSGNRPDNREWHEFSHHIMDDSLIAGDNDMPNRHLGDTNHGGYPNHCTSDSWAEGFAEYDSCLIAEANGDLIPWCYAIGGNACAFNIEANWEAWDLWGANQAEEFAVAGLLWDLVDGVNGADNDWIDMTVFELWNQLNNVNHENVRDIYLTLNTLNWPDADDNGLNDLDELFIAHGHFSDADGDQTYDAGEAIGFTGDAARPNREATPEIPGSYIKVNMIDRDTLEPVDISEFDVEMRVEPPHDYLNVDFTIRKKDNGLLYFTMPPRSYSSKAYIYAKKDGYYDRAPLVIDSLFYWEKIEERGLEHLIEHTFYLKPDGIRVHFVTLTSPSPSDTTETLPASISTVSEGQDYYIEIWASDVGSSNTGLTSVYVDMHFDPCGVATVQGIDHGGIFTESKSARIEATGIDELGGSSLVGVGIEPEWARVAIVKMRAELNGIICCSLSQSDAGIATVDRGLVPWSEIIFSGDKCCFPSTFPTFSDWFSVGKPDCWCTNVNPRQCYGDADGKSQGKEKYWVSTNDLNVLIEAWNKPFEEIDGRDFNGTPLICADFDHMAEGKKNYRVSSNDLDILIANWNASNKPSPDCP